MRLEQWLAGRRKLVSRMSMSPVLTRLTPARVDEVNTAGELSGRGGLPMLPGRRLLEPSAPAMAVTPGDDGALVHPTLAGAGGAGAPLAQAQPAPPAEAPAALAEGPARLAEGPNPLAEGPVAAVLAPGGSASFSPPDAPPAVVLPSAVAHSAVPGEASGATLCAPPAERHAPRNPAPVTAARTNPDPEGQSRSAHPESVTTGLTGPEEVPSAGPVLVGPTKTAAASTPSSLAMLAAEVPASGYRPGAAAAASPNASPQPTATAPAPSVRQLGAEPRTVSVPETTAPPGTTAPEQPGAGQAVDQPGAGSAAAEPASAPASPTSGQAAGAARGPSSATTLAGVSAPEDPELGQPAGHVAGGPSAAAASVSVPADVVGQQGDETQDRERHRQHERARGAQVLGHQAAPAARGPHHAALERTSAPAPTLAVQPETPGADRPQAVRATSQVTDAEAPRPLQVVAAEVRPPGGADAPWSAEAEAADPELDRAAEQIASSASGPGAVDKTRLVEVRPVDARRAARAAALRAKAEGRQAPAGSSGDAAQSPSGSDDPAAASTSVDVSGSEPPKRVRTPLEWAALLGLLREPEPAAPSEPEASFIQPVKTATQMRDSQSSAAAPGQMDSQAVSSVPVGPGATRDGRALLPPGRLPDSEHSLRMPQAQAESPASRAAYPARSQVAVDQPQGIGTAAAAAQTDLDTATEAEVPVGRASAPLGQTEPEAPLGRASGPLAQTEVEQPPDRGAVAQTRLAPPIEADVPEARASTATRPIEAERSVAHGAIAPSTKVDTEPLNLVAVPQTALEASAEAEPLLARAAGAPVEGEGEAEPHLGPPGFAAQTQDAVQPPLARNAAPRFAADLAQAPRVGPQPAPGPDAAEPLQLTPTAELLRSAAPAEPLRAVTPAEPLQPAAVAQAGERSDTDVLGRAHNPRAPLAARESGAGAPPAPPAAEQTASPQPQQAARLAGVPPQGASAAGRTHSPLEPEPIADSTRQFLRPLVGIDPASVTIHRGELAARLTQAHAADAITLGEHVMLAHGQSTTGPSGAALLAHELTHVARHRQPRFVPPVVADLGRAAASTYAPATTPYAPAIAPQTDAAAAVRWPGPAASPIDDDNDEAVAGRVESAVRHSARMAGFQASFEPGPRPVAAPEHYPLPDHDRQHALPDDDRPSGSAAWGGLPAPWEPLPAWLTTPAPAPSTPASSAAADAAQDNLGLGGDNAAALPVYAAEHGRDTDADGSATTPGVTPAPSANPHERTVEPDLDALARQVYTLLRRRLASEQRRFG